MIENAVFNTAIAVLSAAFLSVIPEPDISLCFKHFAKRYTEPVTSLSRRVFMYRVLIVEDDRQIREVIGDYFGRRDQIALDFAGHWDRGRGQDNRTAWAEA